MPFITLLQDKCEVYSLSDSNTDYRALKARHGLNDAYLSPLNQKNRRLFDQNFQSRVGGAEIISMYLDTNMREIIIPSMALSPRVAKFTFSDLCEQPMGAADYLSIAQTFPTVFVSGIPRMGMNDLNSVRRFITMIDCFYDQKVQLSCFADAPPRELFIPEDCVKRGPHSVHDEVFAFDRTVSRLIEMQSHVYRQVHQRITPTTGSLHRLSTNAVRAILKMYYSDGNDFCIIKSVLEELFMLHYGHKNVPDNFVGKTFRLFNGDRRPTFTEFNEAMKSFGINIPSDQLSKLG